MSDVPAAAFLPELHAAYPEAKVIIVQRDPQKWYASCQRTIMASVFSKQLLVLYYLDRRLCRRMAPMMQVLFTSLFGTEYKDPIKMRENWIKGYMEVYDEARKVVPAEQRLEYNLDQGWEPLCKFLGVEVPNKPFPHEHDSASYTEGIQVLFRRMWIRAAKMNAPYVIGGLSIALAYWWYR